MPGEFEARRISRRELLKRAGSAPEAWSSPGRFAEPIWARPRVRRREQHDQDRLRQPAHGPGLGLRRARRATSSASPARRSRRASRSAARTTTSQILNKDSQSTPQRAAQVASDLIHSDKVDLMLTTSTPETVNPVSDACEAAGVPCISTVVPWEAWYFGRGAKPEQASPFRYTLPLLLRRRELLQRVHAPVAAGPDEQEGRRDVAERRRRQRDPRGARPAAREGRLHDRRPGRLPGRDDRLLGADRASSSRRACEIFNTFPIPPDFATFWRQAAQQG